MARDEIQRRALALPAEERRRLVDLLWESLERESAPSAGFSELIAERRQQPTVSRAELEDRLAPRACGAVRELDDRDSDR